MPFPEIANGMSGKRKQSSRWWAVIYQNKFRALDELQPAVVIGFPIWSDHFNEVSGL